MKLDCIMDLIIAKKYGRLANRLILYAHVIACAIENNVRAFNPCLDEYAQYFRSTIDDPLCRYPATKIKFNLKCLTRSRRTIAYLLDKLMVYYPISIGSLQKVQANDGNLEFRLDASEFSKKLKKPGYLFLEGYFFLYYNALIKHQKSIVRYFDLVTFHANNVNRLIDYARSRDQFLIGVHMRRGDYRTWQEGRYYFEDEQYKKVLKRLTNLFCSEDVKFMIASDEDVNLMNFSNFDCVKSTGHPVEDMYCLAGCDLITGPFSTYSSWASFYGNTPIYFIDDPDHPVMREDFFSYAEFCTKHMQDSWQFPEVQ